MVDQAAADSLAGELEKLKVAADYDRDKTLYDASVDIIKGTLDRARADAEFVRNASATILTIYQAVLGLGFVAKDAPVKLSALVGTTFLALAVAGAAGYLAWIGSHKPIAGQPPTASDTGDIDPRLSGFAKWVNRAVLRHVAWLHFAVVCLILGAMALPLPFVQTDKVDPNAPLAVLILLAGGVAVAGIVAWVTRWQGDPTTEIEVVKR